jgi:hypothetical protein
MAGVTRNQMDLLRWLGQLAHGEYGTVEYMRRFAWGRAGLDTDVDLVDLIEDPALDGLIELENGQAGTLRNARVTMSGRTVYLQHDKRQAEIRLGR